MTINDLIGKLKKQDLEKERDYNGTYAVIQFWYEKIMELDPMVNNDEAFNYYYNHIYGMIIGLKAAHYISEKESDDLKNELMQIDDKFYKTNKIKP